MCVLYAHPPVQLGLTQQKTRGLYLIPVKSYNDLKTAYCAEKRAIYNTPPVVSYFYKFRLHNRVESYRTFFDFQAGGERMSKKIGVLSLKKSFFRPSKKSSRADF